MTLSNNEVLELAQKINQANETKSQANSNGISFKNLFTHDYMQKFYNNDIEGLKFYKENIAKNKPMEKQKAIVSQAKTAIRVIASGQSYEIPSLPNRILTPNDITDNEQPIAIYSQLVKVAKELKLDSSSVKAKQKEEAEKEKFIKEAILEQNPLADTIQELKSLDESAYNQAHALASLQWDELQKEKIQDELHNNLQEKTNQVMQIMNEFREFAPDVYNDILTALIDNPAEEKAA